MIRASDLDVGDKVLGNNGVWYEVIENHVGDAIAILGNYDKVDYASYVLHLFYDDIDYLDYAKDILNIDLSLE